MSNRHERRRMSRREFNGYLYKLYGCADQNNVKPDYVWEGDEGEHGYFFEVFLNSPAGGTMVALHFGPAMNWVDVATYAEDAASRNRIPKPPKLRNSVNTTG